MRLGADVGGSGLRRHRVPSRGTASGAAPGKGTGVRGAGGGIGQGRGGKERGFGARGGWGAAPGHTAGMGGGSRIREKMREGV